MNYVYRYNKIIDWIDSCKTHEQLKNMLLFIKNHNLEQGDKLRALNFLSIKNSQITINVYHDGLQKLKRSL